MPLNPVPNYPTSLDSLPDPTSATYVDDDGFELDLIVQKFAAILELLEAKVGIQASTPIAYRLLAGDGVGQSSWRQLLSGDVTPGHGYLKLAEASGTGASGVIEFASISGSFRNLHIKGVGRSDSATHALVARMTMETSPSAGLYNGQRMYAAGATTSGLIPSADENIGAADNISVGLVPGSTSTANLYGSLCIDLPEYANTSMFKTVISRCCAATHLGTGELYSMLNVGVFESTAAITRVRLILSAGNWTTATRFTLYGEPAA